MRNENKEVNEKKWSSIFLSATVIIFLILLALNFFRLSTQQNTSLSSYKEGLAMGHLVGFVETTYSDSNDDKLTELSRKYEELKSSSSISEANEKINEIISLIQSINDELEENNNHLEDEYEEKSDDSNKILVKSNQ